VTRRGANDRRLSVCRAYPATGNSRRKQVTAANPGKRDARPTWPEVASQPDSKEARLQEVSPNRATDLGSIPRRSPRELVDAHHKASD
jgi:hypothetical protein